VESLLATGLVAAALGYTGAAATALWLMNWSWRTRLIKFFFYSGSALTATCTGFSILLEPSEELAWLTDFEWALAFVTVQVVGMWAFVVNTVIESLQRAFNGRREAAEQRKRERR
jgi:hypothetical protein